MYEAEYDKLHNIEIKKVKWEFKRGAHIWPHGGVAFKLFLKVWAKF